MLSCWTCQMSLLIENEEGRNANAAMPQELHGALRSHRVFHNNVVQRWHCRADCNVILSIHCPKVACISFSHGVCLLFVCE